ncbi:hypothetical protein [Pseudomonas frederiksbergensis]|uniref:hypothetical protein n=1 Tax=Pseudomonas frederiksbergensis TaxID=104087 RepID=UPI003D2617F9
MKTAIFGSPFCCLAFEKIAGFASSHGTAHDDDLPAYSAFAGAGEGCDLLIFD